MLSVLQSVAITLLFLVILLSANSVLSKQNSTDKDDDESNSSLLEPVSIKQSVVLNFFGENFTSNGSATVRFRCNENSGKEFVIVLEGIKLGMTFKMVSYKFFNNKSISDVKFEVFRGFCLMTLNKTLPRGEEFEVNLKFSISLTNLIGYRAIHFDPVDNTSLSTAVVLCGRFLLAVYFPFFANASWSLTFYRPENYTFIGLPNPTTFRLTDQEVLDHVGSAAVGETWVGDALTNLPIHWFRTGPVFALTQQRLFDCFNDSAERSHCIWADTVEDAKKLKSGILKVAKVLIKLEGLMKISLGIDKINYIIVNFQDDISLGVYSRWCIIINKRITSNNLLIITIFHELLHAWFGDKVFIIQKFLFEGAPEFFVQTFLHDALQQPGLTDHLMDRMLTNSSTIDTFFTCTLISSGCTHEKYVYSKTSMLLRTLRIVIGRNETLHAFRNFLNSTSYEVHYHSLLSAMPQQVADASLKWLEQSGMPLLTCIVNQSSGIVTITQSKFIVNSSSSEQLYNNVTWPIPIAMVTSRNVTNWNEEMAPATFTLMTERSRNFFAFNDKPDWYLVNPAATVHCRINYDTENWNSLTVQLNRDHTQLMRQDRARIMDDVFALALAGLVETERPLQMMTTYFTRESDSSVIVAVLSGLNNLLWEISQPLTRQYLQVFACDTVFQLNLNETIDLHRLAIEGAIRDFVPICQSDHQLNQIITNWNQLNDTEKNKITIEEHKTKSSLLSWQQQLRLHRWLKKYMLHRK